ncbi:hypothetical protein R5R35_001687 [Gryllus longicercus]|uniref:Uncharacterized protein n=1 Tax=Gryllus longicercus TaxID=2509291 RepID=A0AAN9VLR4_9ORTH
MSFSPPAAALSARQREILEQRAARGDTQAEVADRAPSREAQPGGLARRRGRCRRSGPLARRWGCAPVLLAAENQVLLEEPLRVPRFASLFRGTETCPVPVPRASRAAGSAHRKGPDRLRDSPSEPYLSRAPSHASAPI